MAGIGFDFTSYQAGLGDGGQYKLLEKAANGDAMAAATFARQAKSDAGNVDLQTTVGKN